MRSMPPALRNSPPPHGPHAPDTGLVCGAMAPSLYWWLVSLRTAAGDRAGMRGWNGVRAWRAGGHRAEPSPLPEGGSDGMIPWLQVAISRLQPAAAGFGMSGRAAAGQGAAAGLSPVCARHGEPPRAHPRPQLADRSIAQTIAGANWRRACLDARCAPGRVSGSRLCLVWFACLICSSARGGNDDGVGATRFLHAGLGSDPPS